MDLEKALTLYRHLARECDASPLLRQQNRYPESFEIELPRDDLNSTEFRGGIKTFLALAEKEGVSFAIDQNGWGVLS
jgi:hypothetical protein